MKYAHFDDQTGEVKGFYDDEIHHVIPMPNIEITEEVWQSLCGKHLRFVNGVFEEMPAKLPTYAELRSNEYPDFRGYLDGIVKGDQAQIQLYINECLAVKLKYPKE
jgi:hypothetical protein